MTIRSLKLHELWSASDRSRAQLAAYEIFWVQIQAFLAKEGYALRPRYHSDWVPSWRLTGEYPTACEDSVYSLTQGRVMDALRVADGKRVALKKVLKDSYGRNEIDIMSYLSSEPRRSDPRNRCVPLLDVLDPGNAFEHYIVVTPLLHIIQNPRFLMVGEAMEFCSQILEGLVFLHENHVEHRDCCTANVMMDGEPLYPKGCHPVFERHLPSFRGYSQPLRRSDIPIKYYLIDFGHSIRFESFDSRKPLITRRGQDKTAPELTPGAATDGFKVDVYCIGNLIQEELVHVYPQLARFLQPLAYGMTCPVPDERPTAVESIVWLDEIRQRMTSRQLAARLVHHTEGRLERSIRDCVYLGGNIKRMLWWNAAVKASTYAKHSRIPYRVLLNSQITTKKVNR